jgi:hypothetical protein
MSLTDFSEPQPSLAWTFDGTALDVISGTIGPTSGNVNGVTTTTGLYYDTTTPKYGTGAIKFTNDNPPATGNCLIYDNIFNIPTGSSSFSFWFNALANPASGGGSVFGIRGGTCLLFTILSPGPLRISQALVINNINYTSSWSLAETNISLNQWIHYSYTFTSTRATVYINGVATSTCTYPQINTDSSNVWKGFTLGTYNYGPNFGMSCELDDLRIYNTALTAAQIQSIYTQSGAPASNFRVMPQPRLAWDFNGTTTDYVSGVVPSTVGGTPIYVAGKYGQAINFPNSVNTGTTAPTNNVYYTVALNSSSGYTFSFWVNFNYGGVYAQVMLAILNSGNAVSSQIYIIQNNQLQCFGSGLASAILASPNLNTGSWYHVALSVTTSTRILYLNGVGFTGEGTTGNQVGFVLGGSPTTYSAWCSYDDLRIYNTALSAAQVQSIYQAQGMPSRGVQDKSTYTSTPVATLFGTTFSPLNVRTPAPDTSIAGQTTFTSASGNYSDQGSIALTPLTTGLTVTVKFKLNSYSTNGGVFCLVNNITTNYYQLFLSGTSGSQKASVEMTTDSTSIGAVTPGVISTETIYTLTVVMQNNGYIYLYLDGVLYYSSTTPVTLVNRNYNVYLARERYTGMQGSLTVYDFRVINETLTSDKVLNLYNATTYNVLTPKITLTGAPLFNQLSQSAASSAVGAFSLRAVNGVTAKAVQVRPQGQFPPGPFVNPSGTLNGPYTETITGYAFGGTGTYTVLGSSRVSSGREPWKAFDGFDGGFGTRWISSSTYTANSPYTGPASTTAGGVTYPGEWLQIQLPQSIVLSSYSIYPQATNNIPLTWNVFASNDGSTWTVIDQRGTAPTAGQDNNYTISGTPTSYSYYRIGCYVVSSGTSFAVVEMKLYGSNASWNTDFYADERGNLLTAPVVGTSLQNWLGGATGYVTKWYDQSGKGNDASQNTAAAQPIIQRATKGPGYSVLFNGAASQVLRGEPSTYSLLNGTKYTVSVSERRNNASADGGYFGLGTTSISGTGLITGYFGGQTNIVYAHRGDNLDNTVAAYAGASEPLRNAMYIYSASTPNKRVYVNGSQLPNTNNSYDLDAPSGEFTIGKSFGTSSTSYYYGEIYELLVFTQSLYDLDGTTSINQIYQNQLSYTGS